MPAGPSEVCVMADETANPAFVAADLLSQAEHGVDSQVLLVANSEEVVKEVQEKLKQGPPWWRRATMAIVNSLTWLTGWAVEVQGEIQCLFR